MSSVTNSDRAAWAAAGIEGFTAVCRMEGEDDTTKAKDLVSDIFHFLRLECGLSADEARGTIESGIDMGEVEMEEDED